MTQEALKLAEDYAHMRAIWYVESLYGTSASHTELREKVMLGAHQALKEALAQTQEPVALETLLKWDDDIDPIGEVVGFIEGSPYIMVKVHKGKQVSLDDDLYATPPQRPWVGLTDEEIAQGWKESWVTEQAWQSAVWWAEDKLKERNT
jgi:hypothetical protein